MTKIPYLILSFFIFSNILFASQKLDKVSLQLHWKYQFEFAGFIAAKEMGYYEDEGLDVELKEYQFGMDIEDEVISGRSNYGIYNSNILNSYLQNKPLKLMASFFKKSALVIITKPDIKNPKDLIGKKIMSATKKDFDFNFKYIFDVENISTDSFNFIPHSFNMQDFIDGKCDAVTAYISDQPFILDEKSIDYNIINPSEYGIYNLQLELFTTTQETLKHKQRTKAFKRASIKGWKYALSHKKEIIDIIIKRYNNKLSYDFLSYEARKTELLILPNMYSIGYIDKDFLFRQAELFQKENNLSHDKNIANFIFDDKAKVIYFTNKEKSYLKDDKKVIRVCTNPDWAPIEFMKEDTPVGISIDILKIIQKKTDLNIKFIKTFSWEESQQFLKDKRCDILPSAIKTKKRMEYANFTKPYLDYDLAVFTTDDNPYINNLKSILNKPMLRKKGSGLIAKLKEKYPNIKILETKNHEETFMRISDDNKQYSIAALPVIYYYKAQLGLHNLQISGYTKMNIELSIAVRKDDTILLSIMNKALKSIDTNTHQAIYDKWTTMQIKYKTDYSLLYKVVTALMLLLIIVIFFLIREKRLQTKVLYLNETLEKRVEVELQKNREKESYMLQQSRLAQMGEMINMIAHQWRQPLNSISVTTNNLSFKCMMDDIDKELFNKELNLINSYSQHLSSTIDDFRNFFKDDKVKKFTNLFQLVDDVLKIIQIPIINNNIAIVHNTSSNIMFETYPNEVKHVILNIIKNAEDALLERTVNNPTITIESYKKDDVFTILIKDNAGGIPSDIISKIFDPYFSTKTEKDGTGLGLYMSKTIIQEHCNGSLTMQNDENGAVFSINISDLKL